MPYKARPALMGVNKLWTYVSHRRKGYAILLLEAARRSFVFGYRVPRVYIAWTYTTTNGTHFAENFLRGQVDYAFLTYVEDHEEVVEN
jgi:hypothetical protein